MLLFVCLAGVSLQAVELTGPEIIAKMNDLMNQDSARGVMRMTIGTSSGGKRSFLYETFGKDRGEKNLMRYLEPARVKGDAILMTNNADDIWAYFRRTNRVRKLATHAKKRKLEGSDFSYEDMGSGDSFIEDYDSVLLGEEKLDGELCYKIELQRKQDSNLSYSRLVMWVVKNNFVALMVDYYHEDDPAYHLKRLVMSDIRVINQVPTAMKLVMQNKEDGSETVMEIVETEFGVKLEDSLFTERGMKAK
jgi:outer membrane lipoprotein-sorting protein